MKYLPKHLKKLPPKKVPKMMAGVGKASENQTQFLFILESLIGRQLPGGCKIMDTFLINNMGNVRGWIKINPTTNIVEVEQKRVTFR